MQRLGGLVQCCSMKCMCVYVCVCTVCMCVEGGGGQGRNSFLYFSTLWALTGLHALAVSHRPAETETDRAHGWSSGEGRDPSAISVCPCGLWHVL